LSKKCPLAHRSPHLTKTAAQPAPFLQFLAPNLQNQIACEICGLEATAAEIRGFGRRAGVCAVDLRRPAAAAEVVAATVTIFGAIDVLVNNAGATKRGDFLGLTDDDWIDGFALKLHGPSG